MCVADRLPELLAIVGVLGAALERRLREAGGAPAGLETPGGEACHLQIEALAEAAFLADEVLRRDEEVVEHEREGVHAAVAGRGVGLAG